MYYHVSARITFSWILRTASYTQLVSPELNLFVHYPFTAVYRLCLEYILSTEHQLLLFNSQFPSQRAFAWTAQTLLSCHPMLFSPTTGYCFKWFYFFVSPSTKMKLLMLGICLFTTWTLAPKSVTGTSWVFKYCWLPFRKSCGCFVIISSSCGHWTKTLWIFIFNVSERQQKWLT